MIRRVTAAAIALLLASVAQACPICFREMALTPAQQMATAEAVALVRRSHEATYDVVATIKGDARSLRVVLSDPSLPESVLLVVRPSPSATWSVVGPVGENRTALLRDIAGTAPRDDAQDAQWSAYAKFIFPYLRDPEPIVGNLAYGELTRAPYVALLALKPQLDPGQFVGAIDDPKRQTLYTLLYGIAGGDPGPIESRIDVARRAKDASNLASLLAADLEIRGPSRVAWIEREYLGASDRSLPEIQAALLALSVQGDADASIPRARVIAAFRTFIQKRPAMAAFVLHEFAEWNYWDAAPEYLRLFKAGVFQDPASRVAVVAYLMQSPRGEIKAAARRIAATNTP